jgi:hypothetical protein
VKEDFRVVRDRFAIFTPEKGTHSMLVQALWEESQIKKLQEEKKPLGFTRLNS